MIKEIFKQLEQHRLSPNQIYLLFSLRDGTPCQNINTALEKRLLESSEWLVQGSPTEKALELMNSLDSKKTKTKDASVKNDYRKNVMTYLEIFPKIKLPTGKPARSNINEVFEAFDWFWKTYGAEYSWDIILKATEAYVSTYEKSNWMYMRTSKYFIRKQNSDKTWISDLAEQCQMVKDGLDNDVEKFKDNVV